MKIPFALHRRIPQVRRVLEHRDQLAQDLEATKHSVTELEGALARTEARAELLSTELALRNGWIRQLESDLTQMQTELRQRPVHSAETMILYHDGTGAREQALEILSLLRPMRAIDTPLVRLGRQNDGGYVMLDRGLDNAIAYSLGVGDDVSWDFAMAERGCDIWLYDHTIAALPAGHAAFHWERLGVASQSAGSMRSLADLVAQNGHQGRTDLILKMDIEGYEWEVLEAVDPKVLKQFSQIVMEVHGLAPGINEGHGQRTAILRKLNETHQLCHAHGNNWGSLAIVGGVPIVDVMELCYLRRDDYSFARTAQAFPTPLDQPCHPHRLDYYLGTIGVTPEDA